MDYPSDFVNKIILGDCLDVMKDIPDGAIPLIFTDFPFNIADKIKLTKKDGKIISTKDAWGDDFEDSLSDDEYISWMEKIAVEFDRILIDGGSLLTFFDINKGYLLKPLFDTFEIKNTIAFVCRNPLPHIRKTNYRGGFGLLKWFSKGKPKTFSFLSQHEMVNVFYGLLREHKTIHPNEKYPWQIRPMILRHSKKDQIILDPFCGSGMICAEAKILGRNFIGIEKNPTFFNIATNLVSSIRHRQEVLDLNENKI